MKCVCHNETARDCMKCKDVKRSNTKREAQTSFKKMDSMMRYEKVRMFCDVLLDNSDSLLDLNVLTKAGRTEKAVKSP